MKLTIYAVESGAVVAIKAIREALRVLHPDEPVSLAAASAVLSEFEAQGSVILAETASATDATALIGALGENGVFATSGDPERARLQHDAQKLSEAGATPEDVFGALAPGEAPEEASEEEPDYVARTAMALLAMTEGNPLTAGANASVFHRVTDDPQFWEDVQAELVQTFPWVEDMLRHSGMLLS